VLGWMDLLHHEDYYYDLEVKGLIVSEGNHNDWEMLVVVFDGMRVTCE
jgi:hypothetical protein